MTELEIKCILQVETSSCFTSFLIPNPTAKFLVSFYLFVYFLWLHVEPTQTTEWLLAHALTINDYYKAKCH